MGGLVRAEAKNVSNGEEGIQGVLESLKTMISQQFEIAEAASEAGNKGTLTLMSDDISNW